MVVNAAGCSGMVFGVVVMVTGVSGHGKARSRRFLGAQGWAE